jgi:hypothetical protein
VVRVENKYTIKNAANETISEPAALILRFDPINGQSQNNMVGYLFTSHTRRMYVLGTKKETLFWDFCVPCTKYQTKTCSGGLKTLTAISQGNRSHRFVDGQGNNRIHYYSQEICTPYYGTPELANALRDPDPVDVLFPDFAFFIRGSSDQIFATKATSSGFQFAPLRMFNTHSDGTICIGSTANSSNSDSLSGRFERFMGGRKNTDLTPKPRTVSLPDWVRTYNPEVLAADPNYDYWASWKNSVLEGYDDTEKIIFVQDNYSKVCFISSTFRNLPEDLKDKIKQFTGEESIQNSRILTVPFLQKQNSNEIVCGLDVTSAIDANTHEYYQGVTDAF